MFCVAVVLSLLCVSRAQGSKFILLSSTIGPIDSGIVDLLENEFEKETGIRVRHVGAGTGAALDIAKKGNVDLVLVHAKSLEEKFVKEGFGTERIDLMYNDFVIVGPSNDPAGIKGMKQATEALKKISEKEVTFISRGDKSGTHVAEMELWEKGGDQAFRFLVCDLRKRSRGKCSHPSVSQIEKGPIRSLIGPPIFLSKIRSSWWFWSKRMRPC